MKRTNLLDTIRNGTDSLKELLTIYLIVATIVAGLFAFFEGYDMWTSYWWTFITGLTIGYGDIYPVTIGGKVLTIIWSHFMVLVFLPLMIVRLMLVAVKDKNEFTNEEQEEILTHLRNLAKGKDARIR